jgi:acyl CoA:acetate/3-ketoacid CoA transferase
MAGPVITTAAEAVARIREGATVAIGGSGAGHSLPDALLAALGRRFRETGAPRGITLLHPFGVGNQKDRGLEHMAFPEMYRRVIGGHWSMAPTMAKLAARDAFEAYCFPAGVIVQMFEAVAAGQPGVLTETGLHTFVDPRLEGGKVNARAVEDLVRVMEIDGREYLFYKAPPVNVSLIVASAADEDGNLTMDREVAPWHNCAMAQAARASDGITIAQVQRVVPRGTIDPRRVKVPGIFVDYVVEEPSHGMTFATFFEPAWIGEARKAENEFAPFPFSARKVIARRAAQELTPGAVVNVGFGMPDGVLKVAREQGTAGSIVPTIEQGQIGGIPADGVEFGAAYNPTAIYETTRQFAFYHGRGVDITFLGFLEIDHAGNVNVSKMDGAFVGVGGFIDISQKARKVVFCGMLTAKGKLKIVDRVAQVSFSAVNAQRRGQQVLYVTEQCVMRLGAAGLEVIELAAGAAAPAGVPVSTECRAMDAALFADS